MKLYGDQKLKHSEVHQSVGSGSGSDMEIVILRPNVVWGRGDTLSTEMILGWPDHLPYILIGSSDTLVSGKCCIYYI